jgi:hypothetical protein
MTISDNYTELSTTARLCNKTMAMDESLQQEKHWLQEINDNANVSVSFINKIKNNSSKSRRFQ